MAAGVVRRSRAYTTVVAEGQTRRGGRDTDGCEREPSAHAATSLVGGRECASERRRRSLGTYKIPPESLISRRDGL